ncbi:NUDIX domain-containing protein [Paraurantiacibacter namhicola]|uniref:RNA pyrophosphohydrolase n=1 Tax=Paraurantiacibacter namhicola TaxID=645517 RepID=A0A1C7D6X7_9SPHN|nr:NUDIX domain-containing protein [Paraurantiacibacter namhicola]ANU07234.1 RNA pyrophosphohydrolase [Paraurantiacibacter namhicola]
MLSLLPAPLHRLALRAAHAGRKAYWAIFRPHIQGVCVIATNDAGAVLFARHSYGSGNFLLPTGGMKRGEDALETARREMREELGCELLDARVLVTHRNSLHGAKHTQHLVAARLDATPQPDGREVLEARFFAPDALPDPVTPRTRRQLELWAASKAG